MPAEKPKTSSDTHSHNACAQCGQALLAPSWTEQTGERCIRYLWNCDACGYQFETTVYLTQLRPEFILKAA